MPFRSDMAFAIAAGAVSGGLSVAIALTPGTAGAAAFQLHENSTLGLGTAYAGVAASPDDPSTVFNNPAGMVYLPGFQTYFGGSLIAPSFSFHGTSTNAFGLPISGAQSPNGGHDAAVPYGYLSYKVNDIFAVGLALTAPFGLATYYGPTFVGRYQADKTNLIDLDINPNVAMRITPWLSVGAGISLNRASTEFDSAINSTTAFYGATGQLLPLPDGLFRLRSSDNYAIGYNFGAMVNIDPDTLFGVTYRSRVQHNFTGTAQFNVPYPLSVATAASVPASAKFVLPDSITASLTHAFTPRLTGYATFAWTDWSVFKNLNVYAVNGAPISLTQQNYQNSEFVTVGASYKLTDALTVRGGGGYDVTPVTDKYRTARVPDGDRYLIAIGASYKILANSTVDFAYSHIFVNNPSINELSSTGDLLSGHFTASVELVSLGVRTAF